jgi:hypothetical protein
MVYNKNWRNAFLNSNNCCSRVRRPGCQLAQLDNTLSSCAAWDEDISM